MDWYLIYTKPRQEKCALQNLEQQGYACFLPILPTEKIQQGAIVVADEPLFPRYLFIQLDTSQSAKSWVPIRSTRGVSRLVTFGNEPAKVDARLVELLRAKDEEDQGQPIRLFAQGERVTLTEGAFAGLEAIYEMNDGESRVMVLIEFLSKSVKMSVAPSILRKVG